MEFTVTERENGWRLDRFLKDKLPSWISRSMIQKAIKDGRVSVDGSTRKPSYKVKTGEKVEVDVPQPKKIEKIEPEPIPLNIIYEDNYIVVIDKPAGMIVHPIPSKMSGTLVNALLYNVELKGIKGELRPGIVHRLDKDTSGVMVIAKDDFSHQNLSKQFKDRVIKKVYLAIASGRIEENEFVVNAPIGRHPVIRVKMSVREDGKEALTEFKVLRRFKDMATLVVAKPKTGRTHQIRVHLKHIGHPILGDEVYGRPVKDRIYGAERQMLHALKIGFHHPKTGEWMEFVAPLHGDFKKVLRNLHELEARG